MIEMTFTLKDNTKVLLNLKDSKLTDLKAGDAKPVVIPPPRTVTVNPNPVGLDPEERARRDIQRFRDLTDPPLGSASKPERFTEPYATILKMIAATMAPAPMMTTAIRPAGEDFCLRGMMTEVGGR